MLLCCNFSPPLNQSLPVVCRPDRIKLNQLYLISGNCTLRDFSCRIQRCPKPLLHQILCADRECPIHKPLCRNLVRSPFDKCHRTNLKPCSLLRKTQHNRIPFRRSFLDNIVRKSNPHSDFAETHLRYARRSRSVIVVNIPV